MGAATLTDILESYRAAIVRAQQFGGHLVFDLGNSAQNWSELTDDNFDPNKMFDSDIGRNPEEFIKFVKIPDEDWDREKASRGYQFDLNKKFTISFVINGHSTELAEFYNSVPCASKMNVFQIN